MRKLLILIILFVFNYSAYSQSKILTSNELKVLEDRLNSELANKNLPDKKKFFLTLFAARELMQFRFYEKAQVYYQKAIEMKLGENATESYINLIAIAIIEKDKNKVKIAYENALDYYTKNPKLKTLSIDYYLTSIAVYLNTKDADKKNNIKGYYGHFLQDENLVNLLKNGSFDEAFSLLNPDKIKGSTNDIGIITYDVLNVYINKKATKELFCEKNLKLYPNSFAASIVLCVLLTDYLKLGAYTDKNLKRAKLYFDENPERQYLFDIVKKIKP
jgi:TPR repeat protein